MGKEKKNKIEKTEEKKKKSTGYKVISTLSFIISVVYLSYYIVYTDSIITNLNSLVVPIFIFLISISLFISALKSKTSSIVYYLLSILLIIFMGITFTIDKGILKLPEDEKILSYRNKSYSDFNDWIGKYDIEVITEYEHSDEIEKGNIIRTDINEGTLVKEIKKITVTVSDGPDYDKIVIIPSMMGWNVDDVVEFVNKNFMNNVTINYENSDSERDVIFKQSKNGELRRHESLILTASYGDFVSSNIEMEDLKGKSFLEASLWLKRNGLNYDLTYEFSDKLDKNIVIDQSIEKGKEISSNDKVMLTLSKGKAIKVPDLTKMTVKEITDWVIKNNLKIEFDEIYDEKIETGKVIKQNIEPNKEISNDETIIVTISKGQIKMQRFTSLFEFKEWANKYNVKYSESYEYSDTVGKGNVISYSYDENEIVDPESVIYVRVSLGKAISIPNFIGKNKTEAQNICNNLGIRCSFVSGNYTNYNINTVYVQSRTVGSKVASGSTITLTLSKGIPATYNLVIMQNELSIGNADGTISSLRSILPKRHPGVNFVFQKVKDNTYNSGLISPNSPTKIGSQIKQGNTYTIYVVAN